VGPGHKVSAEVVFCQNGLLTLHYVTVLGDHITVRGSPLFGYPVLLVYMYVTLLYAIVMMCLKLQIIKNEKKVTSRVSEGKPSLDAFRQMQTWSGGKCLSPETVHTQCSLRKKTVTYGIPWIPSFWARITTAQFAGSKYKTARSSIQNVFTYSKRIRVFKTYSRRHVATKTTRARTSYFNKNRTARVQFPLNLGWSKCFCTQPVYLNEKIDIA